jgi:2-desacetyl-2-hydroxyethyl bacteriochlorophyllide A dehydrogenase
MTSALSAGTAMEALVFDGSGSVNLESRPVPGVQSGELLIAVDAVGLCGSDLSALGLAPSVETTPGSVLGHEVTGVVVDATGQHRDRVGHRVAIHPNIACGECHACLVGRPNLCPSQFTLGIHRDGGAAEFMVVPSRHAYRVPDRMEPAVAVLAEPLACVLNGIDKAVPRVGEAAVVLGGGPIGLLFCSVLVRAGVHPVIVSEPSPYRATLARSMGATIVIDPGTESLDAAVSELTSEAGAEIVVDSVGGLVEHATRLVGLGGRVVMFGAHPGTIRLDPLRALYREMTLIGVFTALHTFPRAIRFLTHNADDLTRLVTHQLPLERFGHALELMRDGKAGKVVLRPANERA